jgi:hypothetical protein
MAHATLKLIPGVDENRTPALNEAALSYSQLIRFVPDRQGIGLPQKLGGWTRFYPTALGSIPRALWAWEDTNNNSYLAVGCQTSVTPGVGAPLIVIKSGSANNLVPQVKTDNVAVSVTTTTTSNIVTILDTGSNITAYDAVFIPAHISVAGVVLFGLYQCIPVGANTYQIALTDTLGNPVYPNAAITGGAVASFATTSGSASVSVTLNNHGYVVGNTYPVLISTTVGGIALYGNYIVQSVTSSNVFVIQAATSATSTTTASINGGNARYVYYISYGPLPANSGYGVGGYGTGGYGSGLAPVAATGTNISATDWTLDNWGDTLIACPVSGPVYQWSPETNLPTLQIIPQAPIANDGVFVAMPQRQIVAWGSTFTGVQDPLLLRWCDINNYSVWVAQAQNQAGSFRIPKGSKIVGCIQAPQQGLIWTDLGLWAMQYVSLPDVYQFNELGVGCGMIGRKAAASLNGVVYWMSQSQFFSFSGSGVSTVNCPIWDVIFQDLDTTNTDKIRIAVNSRFGEVSWFYPTKSAGGEVNAYVKYNTLLQQWDYGTLSRTAWINQSVLGPPIGTDPTGLIFQHETSTDADGQAMNSSFQTGYFTLQDGDMQTFIDQVWPDFKWGYFNGTASATLLLTFYIADYPGQTPRVFGPYTMTQATTYITPRLRGRLVSIKVQSNDVGSFWRMGAMRYRLMPDGKF